jgi:hypothetical protein
MSGDLVHDKTVNGECRVGDGKKQQRHPRWIADAFEFEKAGWLSYRDINGGGAFCALLNVEGHALALIQAFETASVDPRMVDEHIRPVFLSDEPVTFLVVKPFYSASCHNHILLSL